MVWLYNGQPYEADNIYYGFVYVIENLTNGRLYVGKKFFTKAGRKQVKGKRKKIRKDSDWQDYFGSNAELKNDVEQLGSDKFTRTIIHLCKTRSECAYMETKEIFDRCAILDPNYYNSWVSCKIRSEHMGVKKNDLNKGRSSSDK